MHSKTSTWSKRAIVVGISAVVAAAAGCSGGGSGTTDAGGDATSACIGASTLCGGSCVDTQNDNANCGACGTACPSGEVCSQGKCATTCGAGTKLCGSACADTKNDPQNCGSCSTKCGTGEVCSNGSCGASCGGDDAGSEVLCTPDGGAPFCANTQTDNANCGGCGVVCGVAQVCQGGACANACASADGGTETLCTPDGGPPYCASTDSDNQNCGGCGVVCGAAESCVGGSCKSVGCPQFDGVKSQAGPHDQYGFCWYVTVDGETCDHACSALGGANLALSAAPAWADACSGATGADVSTWFYDNGNPGGWTGTGTTSYHTLGYGYRNSQYYGKCASGTVSGNGSYPGDTNDSSNRSIVCPCFATP